MYPTEQLKDVDQAVQLEVGESPHGNKRKDKDDVPIDELVERTPQFNTGTVQISVWRRLRDENPYRFEERTYTGDDKEFWTETQAAIWDEFDNCAA
jgi:hypothetical protein